MKWRKKITATALQFAILVSVIVALLLSSFLLFTYTHSTFSIQTDQLLRNLHASNDGINYFNHKELTVTDSVEILLGGVPILLKTKFWGGYQIVTSRGGEGVRSFEKIGLVGAKYELDNVVGLVLEDKQLPLVVVGNTRLEGDVFIPENIVKPGSIGGNYYSGKQLIYGKRYPSSERLPFLNEEWRAYVQEILNFRPSPGDPIVALKNRENSFFHETQVIYQKKKIILDEYISGNIMIISSTEIEVSSYAQLDQVLMIAPKVIFRSGFEGVVHAISEEIIVQENVHLYYPSSLVALGKKNSNALSEEIHDSEIRIEQKSVVKGNVLYLNTSTGENDKNNVLLEKKSFVEGNLYSEGYTELRGTVRGSLYTKYFVSSHRGSLYINHIYDGKILTGSVKPEMAGILLSGAQKNVAIWLY